MNQDNLPPKSSYKENIRTTMSICSFIIQLTTLLLVSGVLHHVGH